MARGAHGPARLFGVEGRLLRMAMAGGWMAIALSVANTAAAQKPDEKPAADEGFTINNLQWANGPTRGELGSLATIAVPEGYRFLNAGETKTLMTMMENPTNGTE